MEFHALSAQQQLDVVINLKSKLIEAQQQRDHLERENAKQAEMLNKVIEQRDELLADMKLIEQQAARIAELEAWRDSWVKCPEGAAAQRIKELEAYNATRTDELLAATRRIKELEAELASIAEGVKISVPTQTMEQEFQNHYRRGYEAGKAALRQRIDDAPVVAHITEDGKVFSNGFVRDTDKPLISKEDLQQ